MNHLENALLRDPLFPLGGVGIGAGPYVINPMVVNVRERGTPKCPLTGTPYTLYRGSFFSDTLQVELAGPVPQGSGHILVPRRRCFGRAGMEISRCCFVVLEVIM